MKISMQKNKWNAFRMAMKDSIRFLEEISVRKDSKISDNGSTYRKLNSALENLLIGRKIYIEASAKNRLRAFVKYNIVTLDRICNMAQTLLEMIESGEATSKTVFATQASSLITIDACYKTIKGQTSIVSSTNKEIVEASEPADSWKDQLRSIKDNIRDDKGLSKAEKERLHEQIKSENLKAARREAHSLFVKNQRYVKRIPNVKTDDNTVEILEMPVIGIYTRIYTKSDFAKAGIEADSVGFYSILHDQIIVGLNLRELHEKGLNQKPYLAQVIKTLSNKVGRRYMLLADKPFKYKDYGFNFFWIMEEKVFNRLTHNGRKRFQVLSWGFAF